MTPVGKNWIIAHRGLWEFREDQNSYSSISNALNAGFAVETDFRDYLGSLVLSHDPMLNSEPLTFDEAWAWNRVAYNLKCDGLATHIAPFVEQIRETYSFVFDGSIPEMLKFRHLSIPHALRLSEYERDLAWEVEFVWVDGFIHDWWMDDKKILKYLENKHLVFVSPELHGRDHRPAFDWFSQLRSNGYLNFSVCTDFPRDLQLQND
jgi:hypothetical protein